MLLVVCLHVFQVADDVGAAAIVDFYLTNLYHLIHPVDRVLSVIDLLFP